MIVGKSGQQFWEKCATILEKMWNNFGKNGQQFWKNWPNPHMVRYFVQPSISPYAGTLDTPICRKNPIFACFSRGITYWFPLLHVTGRKFSSSFDRGFIDGALPVEIISKHWTMHLTPKNFPHQPKEPLTTCLCANSLQCSKPKDPKATKRNKTTPLNDLILNDLIG